VLTGARQCHWQALTQQLVQKLLVLGKQGLPLRVICLILVGSALFAHLPDLFTPAT
jgi:hypothetical protein